MNNIANELLGKALDKQVPYTWHSLNRVQLDDVMKEFAELIVRECVDTIKSNQWAKDNQSWSKGMQYSAELIKQHFGVQE